VFKVCSKCGEEKDISRFHKKRRSRDGLDARCKTCATAAYGRAQSEYYKKNKDAITEYKKRWAEENKERIQAKKRDYCKKNKERINQYQRKKREEDVNYRLANCLRARLGAALWGRQKVGSAVRDLGCTVEFLKQYLESRFLLGMSWDNYGKGAGKWNIDHVRPLSRFDLTDRKQFLELCHFSNLQPLWQPDNYKKSNKLPEEMS
jgi:hypothetical protein